MNPSFRQEIPMPFRGIERTSSKEEANVKQEAEIEINTAEEKLAPEKNIIEETKNADIRISERETPLRGGLDMRLLALLLLLYSD